MADYLPLISRAVSNLPEDTPDARYAIYDRARAALDQQLRSLDPPLPEADIARERSALDEAIARIENDRQVAALLAVNESSGFRPAIEPNDRPAPSAEDRPSLDHYPESLPGGSTDSLRAHDADALDQHEHEQERDRHLDGPSNIPDAMRNGPSRLDAERYETANGNGGRREPAAHAIDEERNGYGNGNGGAARPERPRLETPAPRADRSHRWRTIIVTLVLGTVIAGIAAIAVTQRDNLPEPAPRASQPEPPPPGDRKFVDRVGGEPAPAAGTAAQAPAPAAPAAQAPASPAPSSEVVPVAQRAILYEESPENPRVPVAFNGRVVWRLDSVNVGQGQPAETAVRADAEIPGAGMTLTMILRRNADPALPASHLVQLTFVVNGAGAEQRTVRDVGVLQMKPDENARGTPLAGLPVPVTPNVFLIGLSNIRGDTERNVEALKTSPWIDLPVRFASGRRGIIAIERGISGERAIAEAFGIWGQ